MPSLTCGCDIFPTIECASLATQEDLLCDECRQYDGSNNTHIAMGNGSPLRHQTAFDMFISSLDIT